MEYFIKKRIQKNQHMNADCFSRSCSTVVEMSQSAQQETTVQMPAAQDSAQFLPIAVN